MDSKKRIIYEKIALQIEHKNAIIVTGMRQVGKTTLLRQIFASLEDRPRLWFDLDNPLDMKIFEDIDYRAIHLRLVAQAGNTVERLYIFIDEIQNLPSVTKVIKYLIDHYNVKFFVTGSANFYLKNIFPESLSGRKFLYDLPPLSFREYLYFTDVIDYEAARPIPLTEALVPIDEFRFKKFEIAYEQYLRYGGFPEVALTPDIETKELVLKNIFKSFFEKDLKLLSDQTDIRELRDLLLLLVPRVGSMLDITKLSQELGVNRAKIYAYLEFLQGTFLIRLVPKFSHSVDRTVAGGNKVYFADNGILNNIGQVNEGQILENAVINQLAEYGRLSFYNERHTAEIDAIIDKEVAVEIKTTGTLAGLAKVKGLAMRLGLKKYFVISKKFSSAEGFVSPVQL